MDPHARDWMEFAFNVFYLAVIFSIAGAMLLRLPRLGPASRPVALRLALAFTLLGTGDLGHIGLRILAQLDAARFSRWVGWGGLTTAATVTLFYLLMLDTWRLQFARRFGTFEWLLVAAGVLRLALLLPAQNQWGAPIPPFEWSLARNLPLVVLGLGVLSLYLRDGRRSGQRSIFVMGVLMAISYAFYAPVILLVQRYPWVGLFMIPKTVAYLAMGIVAYRGFFRPWPQGHGARDAKAMTEMRAMNDRQRPERGYLAALLANLAVLLIINLHPVWRPWTHGVVTDVWPRVLWAANLSAVLQIGGNALLLQFRPPLLERATRVLFSLASLLAALVFYVRYPLDFSRVGVGWLDTVAHVLLLLGVIGAALAVVVDLLRLAFPRPGGPRSTTVSGSSGRV